MSGRKKSIFQQIVNRKGWKFEDVAKRWNISERQLSRISNSANIRDIDAANGLPQIEDHEMKELAEYLGLTLEELEDLDVEFLPDTGSSGEMIYSYYFTVPENVPDEILERVGWSVGESINGIPTHFIEPDEYDH